MSCNALRSWQTSQGTRNIFSHTGFSLQNICLFILDIPRMLASMFKHCLIHTLAFQQQYFWQCSVKGSHTHTLSLSDFLSLSCNSIQRQMWKKASQPFRICLFQVQEQNVLVWLLKMTEKSDTFNLFCAFQSLRKLYELEYLQVWVIQITWHSSIHFLSLITIRLPH